MNYRIVKLLPFCGPKATIYSVILEEDETTQTTLYERFNAENDENHHLEVKNIAMTLMSIGHKVGINDYQIKEHEGKPGDGVCALYDDPDKNLRLYGIRFGRTILVLGGGGVKPKTIRALQESDKLKHENNLMRLVSNDLTKRIRDQEMFWSEDQLELLGDFNFYKNE